MKRSPLRRSDGKARLDVAVPNLKRCPKTKGGCGEQFIPRKPLQTACSPECAQSQAAVKRLKAVAKEDKARREKLKTRSDWIQEAEAAVRKFRRLDELAKGRGCMSCGRSQEEVHGSDGWKPGGAWDAGHFLSKGARPELRMEPLNIWLQCKSCNAGSAKYARKGYTVGLAFEENLRAIEGDELVDWLKGPHHPKQYDIDQLKGIKAHYTKLAKELK